MPSTMGYTEWVQGQAMAGRRVLIMGLGRFGGGVGVARYFAQEGARVLITDLAPAEDLSDSLAQLDDLIRSGQVDFRLGAHDEQDFITCDLVITNPAVPHPWSNRYLQAAEEAGVPIATEIGLLIDSLPDPRQTVAVTGTAGKSTTTAMIGRALGTACPDNCIHVGGNIGGSLLGRPIEAEDWVVLELSSAMLYWLQRSAESGVHRSFAPHVAVVTNYACNHVDWHQSESHYRESKQAIHAFQTGADHALLGELPTDWARSIAEARIHAPDLAERIERVTEAMVLPGSHNARNAVLAALAARLALQGDSKDDASLDALLAAASSFEGLPHRLQLVCRQNGKLAYNDSKSTTPQATALAVESFPSPESLHLIVGGYDKKIDLAPLLAACRRCAAVYPIGAVGPALAELLGEAPCGTLESAVAAATKAMGNGDILLLSPGCASWDQFLNYEERGEAFTALAQRLL